MKTIFDKLRENSGAYVYIQLEGIKGENDSIQLEGIKGENNRLGYGLNYYKADYNLKDTPKGTSDEEHLLNKSILYSLGFKHTAVNERGKERGEYLGIISCPLSINEYKGDIPHTERVERKGLKRLWKKYEDKTEYLPNWVSRAIKLEEVLKNTTKPDADAHLLLFSVFGYFDRGVNSYIIPVVTTKEVSGMLQNYLKVNPEHYKKIFFALFPSESYKYTSKLVDGPLADKIYIANGEDIRSLAIDINFRHKLSREAFKKIFEYRRKIFPEPHYSYSRGLIEDAYNQEEVGWRDRAEIFHENDGSYSIPERIYNRLYEEIFRNGFTELGYKVVGANVIDIKR